MNDKLVLLIILICGVGLGVLATIIYQEYDYQKKFNGLRFEGNYTKYEAIAHAREWDSQGDWVAINVRGMSYGEAEATCNHECMHSAYSEILSEACEKNFTKCGELINNFTA